MPTIFQTRILHRLPIAPLRTVLQALRRRHRAIRTLPTTQSAIQQHSTPLMMSKTYRLPFLRQSPLPTIIPKARRLIPTPNILIPERRIQGRRRRGRSRWIDQRLGGHERRRCRQVREEKERRESRGSGHRSGCEKVRAIGEKVQRECLELHWDV